MYTIVQVSMYTDVIQKTKQNQEKEVDETAACEFCHVLCCLSLSLSHDLTACHMTSQSVT